MPSPFIVAGLLCVVALSASLLTGNGPMETLGRGAAAFGAGYVIANIWGALFSPSASSLPLSAENVGLSADTPTEPSEDFTEKRAA